MVDRKMTQEQYDKAKEEYIGHISEITKEFNIWAGEKGLNLNLNADKLINAVSNNLNTASRVIRFASRIDDTGIIHLTQLRTAIDCFWELLRNPYNCGHVLGAMQSGKTTTSLALQWSGPALYLLNGSKAYPFYIISNQTNHEDQTVAELKAFLSYYGDIEMVTPNPTSVELDVVFAACPSLSTYKEHVLVDADDTFNVPQLSDEIHRRVGGGVGIKKIAARCKWATEQGFRPLMIIDEPQYGASDRVVTGDDGQERYPCVLAQIFNRIEEEIGTDRSNHWFVGLSATPFELNDLSKIWEVRQYLSENYSGYNFFNGEEISANVAITPPTTIGQTVFAHQIGIPFLAQVSTAGYHGNGTAFEKFARKVGYSSNQEQYREDVADALRKTISYVLENFSDSIGPIGLCIRAFNNNVRTEEFISRLQLDSSKIEVLNYYGGDATGASIKRIISQRKYKHLPYLIFVTSRARMADAFPVEVKFFMDFSQKASDLNALLQGLLGRACGYNKRSTVVLSDQNIGIVEAYVATNGGYVHRTSRHSIAVGGFRRGAPTSMIKLHRDMDDPVVKLFFEGIDKLVENNLVEGTKNIKSLPRVTGNARFRTGPILTLATELNLFSHIEHPQVRTKIFPQLPTGFIVARPNDQVKHPRKTDTFLSYSIDINGYCRYTFRWSRREDGAQGGAAGRAKGQRDADGLGTHMEPTVYVEKYETNTGQIVYDRSASSQIAGKWRAFMVTFPLLNPVRELQAAEIALPTETCVYDYQMTADERTQRAAS